MRAPIFAVFGFVLFFSAQSLEAQSLFDLGKDLMQCLPGLSGGGSTLGSGALSATDIIGGPRDALRVGSERVVGTSGQTDGFKKSGYVHIPLPGSLQKVQSTLKKVGMSGLADDLELRLNRAAEAAVPKAKTLFFDAISQMTIEDGKNIQNGPKDAATQYFLGKMSQPLAADMKPIVDEQLSQVGAVAAFNKMMGQYNRSPSCPTQRRT